MTRASTGLRDSVMMLHYRRRSNGVPTRAPPHRVSHSWSLAQTGNKRANERAA